MKKITAFLLVVLFSVGASAGTRPKIGKNIQPDEVSTDVPIVVTKKFRAFDAS